VKQVGADRLEWLDRQQQISRIAQARSAGQSRQGKRRQGSRGPRRRRSTILQVPVHVLAERAEDRAKLSNVINSMLAALAQPGTKVKLDFTRTVKMYPGGTLILLAYLELLLERFPGRIAARCVPRSLAAQLMRHFGLADRLGINSATSTPTHDSVVRWKYLTGEVADGTPIAELLDSYRRLTAAKIPEGLYESLTEALTNVRQHAYPAGGQVPEGLRRWWLFAKHDEPVDGHLGGLFIGVYDIGIGIQQSMRGRLKRGEKLLDKSGQWLDILGLDGTSRLQRLLLEAAVERNRTSTGLSYRGKGLPEMRDFVLGTPSGRLSIVSGRAQYSCSLKMPSNQASLSRAPILGTLILWSIPLEPLEVTQ
jgi:hypothetical protein